VYSLGGGDGSGGGGSDHAAQRKQNLKLAGAERRAPEPFCLAPRRGCHFR